jgi:glutamyl-tRNA reductase
VLGKPPHQLRAGHDPGEVLDFLANTLTNRLLHAPTVALRQAALEGDTALARATEKLFPDGDAS